MPANPATPTPNHPEQALARAIAHGQRGQGAQALTALLQALDGGVDQQQPNHLISQRLISGAVPALARAIAFASPTADARRLQSLRRSLAAQPCRRAAGQPAPTATGNSAARAQDSARAKQARSLISHGNSNGETLYQLGQFKLAADDFQRAPNLDPNNAWICQNLAETNARLPRIHPIPQESALFLRTDAKIQATFRQWDADCRAQGKARWVEKTPPHSFQVERFSTNPLITPASAPTLGDNSNGL